MAKAVPPYSIERYLKSLIRQLEQRIFLIPRWEKGGHLGQSNFTTEDIPALKAELEKCKAALKAVQDIKTGNKK